MSTIEISQARRAAFLAGFASRLGLAAVLLACSLAVFLFGPKHAALFPTNGSILYNGMVSAVFLGAALVFKRSDSLAVYWGIPYAFFIAAAVNLNLCLFGTYSSDIQAGLGVSGYSYPSIALDKACEAFVVIATILALTRLSGSDLGSLFIRRVNLHRMCGWGLASWFCLTF